MCLKGGSKEKEKGVRDIKFLRGEREGKEDRDREIETDTERQKLKREQEENGELWLKEIVFFLFSSFCVGVSCSDSSSLKRDEK